MSKKFKLVYESEGMLKGNYSGIPGTGDTNVIERAVLDGSKPAPSPTPGPSPELVPSPIPEGEGIRLDRTSVLGMFGDYALRLAEASETPLPEDAFAIFGSLEFKYDQKYVWECSISEFIDLWWTLDTDSVKLIITELHENNASPWFYLSAKANEIGLIECTSENSMGLINEGNFGISIEIDAETGDSRNVVSLGTCEFVILKHKN